VVPIVRSHHEAWDGSGYPDGLKGEEIPIGARLLTAVDCFDALASERPYRKALPLDVAMAMVKARSGIQFDPKIVELLAAHYLELEEKARQQSGDMVPLKTDLTITRGAAPGAGFEQEPDTSAPMVQGERGQSSLADGIHVVPQPAGQSRKAEASREAQLVLELSQAPGVALSARDASSIT
jgi:hypothetical protein